MTITSATPHEIGDQMKWYLRILAASLLVGTLFPSNLKANTTANTYEQLDETAPSVVLLKIALCESSLRQFNPDGTVLRGIVNKQDKGMWQINEYWNGAAAKKLGYNLDTLDGNMNMAIHLYKTQGTKPWGWSKFCWNRPLEVIMKEKGFGKLSQ